MRAKVDTQIMRTGGSVTHTLRERAVMVGNPPVAGRSGMKKVFPRRALHGTDYCEKVHSGDTNFNVLSTS